MGRKSVREARRHQIAEAFAEVLAERGFAASTIVAVAEQANVSPGLLHHHFKDKDDLLEALLSLLIGRLRTRLALDDGRAPTLDDFITATLRLDDEADVVTARCWVGVFAEAVRKPALGQRLQRLIGGQMQSIRRMSSDTLSDKDAMAILAFVVGALVVGVFAGERTTGFAERGLRALVVGLAELRMP